MNIEELRDNYLISMGCSISDKYGYILDDGFDFQKEEKKEMINISGTDVLLSKDALNTVKLNRLLYGARNAYSKYSASIISNSKDIEALCSGIFNASKLYFTDHIKFFTKKLEIDETLLNHLITLVNTNIDSISGNIYKVMQNHQINLANIHQEAVATENSQNIKDTIEAANSSTYSFGTTNYYPSLTGWGGTSYTTFTNSPTVSQRQLNAYYAANSSLARITENIKREDAQASVIKEISEVIDKATETFNQSLFELLVLKANKYFNIEVYNGVEELSKNPVNIASLIKFSSIINENDYPKFKEVVDYYDIDILYHFEIILMKTVSEHYFNTKKCDYNENDWKIYKYLKGENIVTYPRLSKTISNKIVAEANNIKVKYKQDYSSVFATEKERIQNCAYITEEDKKESMKKIDEIIANYYKGHKYVTEYTRNVCVASGVMIAIILTVILCWPPKGWFWGLIVYVGVPFFFLCYCWFVALMKSDQKEIKNSYFVNKKK